MKNQDGRSGRNVTRGLRGRKVSKLVSRLMRFALAVLVVWTVFGLASPTGMSGPTEPEAGPAHLGSVPAAFLLDDPDDSDGDECAQDGSGDTVRHNTKNPASAPPEADIGTAVVIAPGLGATVAKADELVMISCEIADEEGGVGVKRKGSEEWEEGTLKIGDVIREGDRIATGWKTTVTLQNAAGATIRMEPLSELKVTKHHLETSEGELKINSEIKLEFGTLEIEVKKSGAKMDLKVSTPNSSTAIRGTHVRVMYDPVAADVTWHVAEGTVEMELPDQTFTVDGPGDYDQRWRSWSTLRET